MFNVQHYNFIAKRFREQLASLFEAEEHFRAEYGDEGDYAGIPATRQLDKTRLQSRTLVSFAIELAKHFKKDNENFDPVRFLDACSPDSERYPLSELWDAED